MRAAYGIADFTIFRLADAIAAAVLYSGLLSIDISDDSLAILGDFVFVVYQT